MYGNHKVMGFLKDQRGTLPILILVVGLIILVASYFFVNKPQEFKPSILQIPSPKFSLTLDSPNSHTVAVNDFILISGKTSPNTRVVLFNDVNETILESDQNGKFLGKVQLDPGNNSLTVTAFSDQGEEKTLQIDVLYNPKS